MSDKREPYEGWSILELLGHRRLAGFVREVSLAGAGMLRLDVFLPNDDKAHATQFYSPSSLYCLTPTTEEIARRLAQSEKPAPVSRFDLPALPAPKSDVRDGEIVDDEDEFSPGDVVRLKSGGPRMTVENTYDGEDEPQVECSWFTGNELNRDTFREGELEEAPPPAPDERPF